MEEGILYDALGEREFSEALLDAIASRRHFRGTNGELTASRPSAFRQLWDPAEHMPEPAVVKGEHANTCIAYGDRWLLKLFRRVEEGMNPELELGRFLTERTPFAHVPPTAGTLEYRRGRGTPMTLGILSGFVPNEGDAWRYTLDTLGRYYERVLTEKAPPPTVPRRGLLELAEEEMPPLAQELIGPYLESARLLGQRTAEFHLALASAPEDPALAPEPFTTLYQRSLYQSMRSQLRQTMDLLRKRLKDLPEALREDAQKLLGREDEILQRGRVIFERKIHATRQRGHGDFHLAQVLYTGKDFVILGLDGQTRRPVSERRLKRSPLKDVASVLRSFHYAALSALEARGFRPEDRPVLEPWVPFWHRWVSVAFLKAYLETAATGAFLPKEPQELRLLLGVYLIRRVTNELRYELTQRLDRVAIPLQGLTQLLDARVESHAGK